MAAHACSTCCSCYRKLIGLGKLLQPILLLAMRLFWGYLFLMAGIHKLTGAAETAKLFQSLSIPLPHMMAYIVGIVETVGGGLLILGLGSRFAALALSIVMIVALLTANYSAVSQIITDPQALIKSAPFNFLWVSLLVFAFGPGCFSVDALLKRFWFKNYLDDTKQPPV
jgi:putative oxidoreductase